MNRTCVITKAPIAKDGRRMLTTFLLEDGRLCEVHPHRTSGSLLGNIYVGKIKNVVKNIEAAFVEIAGGQSCFLPFSEAVCPILTNRAYDGRLLCGDEILVQVTRDRLKTKDPALTAKITLEGRWCAVVVDGGHGIRYSRQLSEETAEQLPGLLKNIDVPEPLTLIVRTKAGELTGGQKKPDPENTSAAAASGQEAAPLLQEAQKLLERAQRLLKIGKTRTVFSLISEEKPEWLAILQEQKEAFDKVVTDEPAVYNALSGQEASGVEVSFYTDEKISLFQLYGLSAKLDEALSKRVWLKSGGYLVIEPTEALTVIDVNTGKFDGKKKTEETFALINREAAQETARQMRLRNLSGIIIVDFINQEKAEAGRLLEFFRECCKKDTVPVRVVDMTPLGLVEITRKKVRRPLAELIREAATERK